MSTAASFARMASTMPNVTAGLDRAFIKLSPYFLIHQRKHFWAPRGNKHLHNHLAGSDYAADLVSTKPGILFVQGANPCRSQRS
jgi:hypothetical protein